MDHHSVSDHVFHLVFLQVADAMPAGTVRAFRKVFVHLLPNCLAPLIIQMTLRLGTGIAVISSLSFIGLGVQPPTPEWGSIISSARQYYRDFWPIVTFPGLMISLTIIGFNVFGDGLRDALDPRQK